MSNFSKFLVQPRLTSSAVKAALLTVCVVLCAAALWHRPVTASSEPAIQFKFTAINFPDAFWTVAYAINEDWDERGEPSKAVWHWKVLGITGTLAGAIWRRVDVDTAHSQEWLCYWFTGRGRVGRLGCRRGWSLAR